MNIVRSFRLWFVALVCVVGVVLISAPGASSQQSRIQHLETLVKCPACEDNSVAQSNATSAVAVRHEIAQRVRAGASDSQILTSLEATYGTAVLLSPSTSGIGSLLWLAPVAALVAMLFAAVRLWRRR
jgi:cytochrome c-type biogenesis protein CcmH/NrfF